MPAPDQSGLRLDNVPRLPHEAEFCSTNEVVKSTFATVNWPVWTWAKYPARCFLFASHKRELSLNHPSTNLARAH